MDLMQSLQGLFNQFGSQQPRNSASAPASGQKTGTDGLSDLLGPSALGGLAGALLGGRSAGGLIKGALLGGGGAYLWNKYKDRIMEEMGGKAKPAAAAAAEPEDKAVRMIRAVVFAAKADGHIDDTEKASINRQVNEMNIGRQAQQLVQEAMNEPLDPRLIADGVTDPEEALQLFTVSCAAADSDHFMVKSYLDALAIALNIPADVKSDLMDKLKKQPV